MEENQTDKYIFTDTYKTKDLLWDAYSGYLQSYYDYISSQSIYNDADPTIIASLTRYANYFYDEVKDFLDKFTDKINNLKEIHEIFKKNKFDEADYKTIRQFTIQFMTTSGIRNILKDKEDMGKSIHHNR